ncbi:hypothetical protein KCU87_g15, partial [Aureobasidium melanogenum]
MGLLAAKVEFEELWPEVGDSAGSPNDSECGLVQRHESRERQAAVIVCRAVSTETLVPCDERLDKAVCSMRDSS